MDLTTWPGTIFALGVLFMAVLVLVVIVGSRNEHRKVGLVAKQEGDLRQLIHRYEQLAENTLDAQQRAAADVAELRARTAAIEQILRTVE